MWYRKGEIERDRYSILLVHFPNGYNWQIWAWLEPGAGYYILVSHMGGSSPGLNQQSDVRC